MMEHWEQISSDKNDILKDLEVCMTEAQEIIGSVRVEATRIQNRVPATFCPQKFKIPHVTMRSILLHLYFAALEQNYDESLLVITTRYYIREKRELLVITCNGKKDLNNERRWNQQTS